MLLIAAAMVLMPIRANAGPEGQSAADSAFELAKTQAECAGFWRFSSKLYDATGEKATAEQARGMARGAELTAGYFLSQRYVMENPDAKPKRYGDWDSFIQPMAEITENKMASAAEQNDMEPFKHQGIVCAAAGHTAETIVNQIRADATLH